MRSPFRRRSKEPEGALRTKRDPVYFCATCAVNEGERHLDWCHRQGVMTTRPSLSEGSADRG